MVFLVKNRKLFKKRFVWILLFVISIAAAVLGTSFLKGLFVDTKYNHYASVNVSDFSFLGSLIYVVLAILIIVHYKKLSSNESIKTQLIITNCFLLSYPFIYILGAYRIPNYYALPRLLIWSILFEMFFKQFISKNEKTAYRVFVGLLVILYLLFRFTRYSVNGGFEYFI